MSLWIVGVEWSYRCGGESITFLVEAETEEEARQKAVDSVSGKGKNWCIEYCDKVELSGGMATINAEFWDN